MRRRLFLLAVLQLLASTLSGPAAAQPATKVYRVGMLCAASCTTSDVQTFRRELAALGYKDGVNVAFEDRPYGDDLTRIPEIVSDLVRQNVDLIYSTFGTVGGLAAKRATTSIPIVVGSAGDIVGAGMAKSLGHPGGNVTGITSLALELEPKRLELLKQLLPTVSRIAFFHDTENTYSVLATKEQRIAAAQLGVDLKEIQVHKTSDIDRAFAEVIGDRVNALCVDAYMPLLVGRDRIVELAAKHRVAAIYPFRQFVEAGGLLSYGSNLNENAKRAAALVAKILDGAKPADLPVEQSTRVELVINLKTAKALELTVPQSILARADEVIE
jgi:putative tryptophan/tyrosine transport system substrate-binding protein